MSPPWDVFGVGAAVGGAAGLWLGYEVRKLVVRVHTWRTKARFVDGARDAMDNGKITMNAKHEELPPVIPIKRVRRPSPRIPDLVERSANPDRDVVLAALMGAGYSKADAVKAVDACSLAERAAGPEHWTVAALRHAHGAK